MAQHAILTNKSNQRIAAAIAASGLVGAGLAFPFAQASLANGVDVDGTCTITDNGASSTTLRIAIDAAIANTSCEVIVVNNTASAPLDLEVEGSPIYVGPSDSESDTRTSIRIESTTGLNIKPAAGYTSSLMELQDESSWSSSSSLCNSSTENCTGMNSLLSNITIEGLTFRDSARSAVDGFYFGNNLEATFEINNSRFVNNNDTAQSASEAGGAVNTAADVVISNSSFVDNYALNQGGAVKTYGKAYISNSLFASNSTEYDGGAVYAGAYFMSPLPGTIYSVNSSFVDNTAAKGGALFNYRGDTELVLNTFFGNVGHSGAYSQQSQYGNPTTKLWGNIFGNYGWRDGREVEEISEDLGYNIYKADPIIAITSTTSRSASLDEFAFVHDFREQDEFAAFESIVLAHAAESSPVTTAPAFEITSSSIAAGFVKEALPSEEFDNFFDDKISVDQLGTSRTLPFAAGAHQASARRSSGGTAPVVVAPVVPKEAMVPGFAANSTKLTKSMKKEIRQFLKANPNLKNVVCKGYTSSPSTPQDRTLARKRGKATCDYILTLRPDAQVTIRSGSHTNKPGSQIRRVNIRLS
jgi:predicted outer membrane repeat protein